MKTSNTHLLSRLRVTALALAVMAAVFAGSANRVSANLIVGVEQYNPGLGETGPPSPINCVSGDLLEMPGVVAAEGEIAGWRNGSYDATINYKSNDPYTLTYTLAPNATGYDIKEIRVFSGWSLDRSGQSYDILYSLVETPDTFVTLGTVLTPPGRNGAIMTRTYDSSAGISPDTGSPILTLTRVAKIRFNFRPDSYGTVLREIDVTGSPTPSPPQKNITSLAFPTFGNASILGSDIRITLPLGSSLNALAPAYTLSYGATCIPASGSPQNFSSPVRYTVTASDQSTNTYTVTAAVRPVPDPLFTLAASTDPWDGRQTMTVTPIISNWNALQATGGTNLNCKWSVTGLAVSKQITPPTPATPGSLTLLRSQGSGPLTVTLVMDNGGWPVTRTLIVNVQEPATDAWVQRTPDANEKPVNNQFFARDDSGFGTIYYNGSQPGATAAYLKIYRTDSGSDIPYSTLRLSSLVAGAYQFSAPIAAGLFTYKAVFGTTSGGIDTDVATVTNLVCGDAYVVGGQSNAVADNADNPYSSQWIRSFGNMSGGTDSGWGNAVRGSNMGDAYRIGYWPMDLAINLVATYNVPICIMNGGWGGTRIDQHQANPADHYVGGSSNWIYANLVTRVAAARLTHGIRAVLWHQGESDSDADAPTGDYNCKSYQQYFIDLAAAWKQDYPNVKHYYIYQVWPFPCRNGPKGDQLREAQRNLPHLFSNLSVMSSIGVTEPWNSRGLCHFDSTGYAQLAAFMAPLVKQYSYGMVPSLPVTPPNLLRAWFTSTTKTAINLEFDQDMAWTNANAENLYLDGLAGLVTSGSASGHLITLQLNAATTATTITYLMDRYWDGSSGRIFGANGIAALTFADVPIVPRPPEDLIAVPGNNQVALMWTASAGATGYNVTRSPTSGGPYTVISTPPGTSYTDTEVTVGTYYYVVSATNTSAEGTDTPEVGATLIATGTGTTTATVVRHSATGSATTYGDAMAFDVTVAGLSVPSGIVTLMDGGVEGTLIGIATLIGGTCTITPLGTALTPGTHDHIMAIYSGDMNFASSASNPLSAQSVSPKVLTVTGAAVTPKAYDGTLTATLTGATLSGVVGSDPVFLGNQTAGTFDTKNVGTAKSVTTAMTLTGMAAGYYTLTQPALTGQITAKPLTITGMAATGKTYDGTTAAVLTRGGWVGVVSGESVTLIAGTGNFASANAGTWAVTATGFALGGANAGNYTLSAQPVVPDTTITVRPVCLAGMRVYDGTAAAATSVLSVSNKVNGDDLSPTGSANLVSGNVGAQTLATGATPAHVQHKTGSLTGGGSATSFNATALTTPPTAGNTLVAVIATCDTSQNPVSGIGATSGTILNWQCAAQSTAVANGTTTEVWYAPVLAGAGSTVMVNLARAGYGTAAVVAEYSGLLTAKPVDRTAGNSGASVINPAGTGTTATTMSPNELAFGGIGLVYDNSGTFSAITGGSQITNVSSGKNTSRVRLYAIATTVTTPATASFTGTMNRVENWSGAIATFKPTGPSTLALSGSAASNYTLAGATGSVTITPLPITVSAVNATKTYDATTTAPGTPTLTPALVTGDSVAILAQVFQTPDAGTGNKTIIPHITINDGNGGANYAATLTPCHSGTIFRAPATIALANLAQAYDGTPKVATATTSPPGKTIAITYNGSATAPSNAGSYAVVATITDPNYTGAASGTLVIGTVSLDPWRTSQFTPEQIAAGLAADNADPDGDGFTNLDEYVMGTNPQSATPQPLAITPTANNRITLTFFARSATGSGYAGLTRRYDLQQSTNSADPGSWQPVAGYTDIVGTDQTVTVTLPISAPVRFHRLKVRLE